MCIDAGHQSLASSFFITCSAVNLACKVKIADNFRLQSIMELCGVKIVILNSITRTENLSMFKTGNQMHSLNLDILRQRRRESIEIILVGVTTFRLEEKLMTGTLGKPNYFILYGRTIAWTHALDSTLKHRGLFKTFLQNFMDFFIGISNPTT